MNGYTETESGLLVDLKKIARIDVVRRDLDDEALYIRWTVMLCMLDGSEILYLNGGVLQGEANPCYSYADGEISVDERDTMNQVAAELMLDCSSVREIDR